MIQGPTAQQHLVAGKILGAAHSLTAGVCMQGEAQSFGGRRRSISWRDRAGVALTEEDSQGMVSRERSSHGFLPDVHEEVRRPAKCVFFAAKSTFDL